jgi:hypothetical protein
MKTVFRRNKMKTVWIMVIVLLVAANAHAGSLQDRVFGDLLGIEPTAESIAEEASPSKFTFWLLGTPTDLDNPDAEISARAGWLNDDLEIGVQFDAVGVHGDNDEAFGIFCIMHVAGVLESTYVGYAAGIQDIRSYGPIFGTILGNAIVEYRYRDFSSESPLGNATDRHQMYAGFMFRY